jgi:hypothetical protein
MRQAPTFLPPHIQPERDPLATIAVSAAPVVLEGRYRLLMRALWELRHSRRTRWGLGLGSAAFMLLLAFLAVRHFATTSWPLSRGKPGLLVAAGLLLLDVRDLDAQPAVVRTRDAAVALDQPRHAVWVHLDLVAGAEVGQGLRRGLPRSPGPPITTSSAGSAPTCSSTTQLYSSSRVAVQWCR